MNCYLLLTFINEKIILENIRNSYFLFSCSVCKIASIIALLSETLFKTGETGPDLIKLKYLQNVTL